MKETQETIGQWTRETFPQYESMVGRFTAIIEEMVEVACAAGIDPQHIVQTVDAAIKREQAKIGTWPNLREEIGDLYMNVLAFAEHAHVNAHEAAEEKMAVNRSRSTEYYRQKVQEKIAAGIRPHESH